MYQRLWERAEGWKACGGAVKKTSDDAAAKMTRQPTTTITDEMKRQSVDGHAHGDVDGSGRGKKRKLAAMTLPDGVSMYTKDTVPWDLVGYWRQRYSLFSLWDEGIWITDEGYYSVTPEQVAHKIARHILPPSLAKPQVIIDAFCGVGGNAIQFALSPQCEKVIAIDHDETMLACARHNAAVYGVAEKIEFVKADFFEYAKRWDGSDEVDVVFMSPPWGGPSYKHDEVFDLQSMTYGGAEIYAAARKISSEIVMYLPRNGDLNQIARYEPDNDDIKIVHYCLQERSKALCAYFGSTGAGLLE
ncbi:Trimethylguanosine synthase [Drechslerella dactyloides]|uniref:Trimethylguanosine synthase n=1 Tax=Drechslerella dactyloides TaxID=74499 RepID=A0AAD6IRI1_DREDA|nr:Trimethylguanosine synthase [Drechslerella dactyloides]